MCKYRTNMHLKAELIIRTQKYGAGCKNLEKLQICRTHNIVNKQVLYSNNKVLQWPISGQVNISPPLPPPLHPPSFLYPTYEYPRTWSGHPFWPKGVTWGGGGGSKKCCFILFFILYKSNIFILFCLSPRPHPPPFLHPSPHHRWMKPCMLEQCAWAVLQSCLACDTI